MGFFSTPKRARKKWGIPECSSDDFDFLRMIQEQNLAVLRQILDQDRSIVDVLWACELENSELAVVQQAIASGNLDIVKLLVNAFILAGIDVHRRGDFEDPPVVAAAVSGHLEIADYLLTTSPTPSQIQQVKRIVDLLETRDIESDSYKSLFLQSCKSGNLAEVSKACQKGIDVNMRDEFGTPALHLACVGQHLHVIESLVSAGANLESTDSQKRTPLLTACSLFPKEFREKAHSVVSLLLKHGAKVDAVDKLKTTSLMFAVEVGDHQSAGQLIAAGANVERKDKAGNMAVHYLGGRKYGDHRPTELTVEIARTLVSAGVDLYATNETGSTAFMHGTRYIRRLAEYKSELKNTGLLDPRVDDLLKASRLGNDASASKLLQQGVDPNRHDSLGECFEVTPLHLAALNGHVAIVTELLKANASTAMLGGYSAEIKAWFFQPLVAAAASGHLPVVEELIKANACLEALSRNSIMERQTALMFAIDNGHFEVVEALLKAGAEANAPNSSASDPIHSPLWLARQKKQRRIADLLEDYGAVATVYHNQ